MGELERLRDRVAELEDILGLTAEFPRSAFGIKPGKWQRSTLDPLLGLLLAREFVPHAAAYDAVFGARPEAEQPSLNCISVAIHHLRKALRPHGVAIKNLFGEGYYIEEADKKKLRAALGMRDPQA